MFSWSLFHTQGLPLHVQIDTFEDPRDATVFHRGYCQIKVFCDKVSDFNFATCNRQRVCNACNAASYHIQPKRGTHNYAQHTQAGKQLPRATG